MMKQNEVVQARGLNYTETVSSQVRKVERLRVETYDWLTHSISLQLARVCTALTFHENCI